MTTLTSKGYGATGSVFSKLAPMEFEREAPKADEVLIDILYCGVCHSDLHQVRNDWKNTIYPCVPGHEIIGRVVETGSSVSKFKVGDTVGVGCMIDSCGKCASCHDHEEQYCAGPVSWTATYNGYMKPPEGSKFNTYGGYSNNIVVREGLCPAHSGAAGYFQRSAHFMRRRHHLFAAEALAGAAGATRWGWLDWADSVTWR